MLSVPMNAERAARVGETLPRVGVFRVLVCRTSHSLGNTLFMTPLLQEIEAQWPGAEVDLITRYASAAQVFSNYASVRRVFALPRRFLRHPVQWLKIIHEMRQVRYDVVIDTDVRSKTGRQLLRLANAHRKLGFSGRRGLSTEVDVLQAPKHAAQFPVYLLRQGLDVGNENYPLMSLRLTTAETQWGRAQLARVLQKRAQNKLGTIGIFANATGPKAMPAEWWAAFMRVIEARLPHFEIVEIVPAFGQSMLGSRYPAYFSSDIRNLAKFMSSLTTLICLDCGIMHLARAGGVSVAAVFTTTDVAIWGPYGDGAYFVQGDREHPADAASRLMDVVPLFTSAAA